MWNLLELIFVRSRPQILSLLIISFAILATVFSAIGDIKNQTGSARTDLIFSVVAIGLFLILYLALSIWALRADFKKLKEEKTKFNITVGGQQLRVDLQDLDSLKRQLNEIEQSAHRSE
jgi:hypothetical protein